MALANFTTVARGLVPKPQSDVPRSCQSEAHPEIRRLGHDGKGLTTRWWSMSSDSTMQAGWRLMNFTNEVSSTLPFEVGLSLFRVLQEALHNAQKHSGVERIEVQLREDSGEIHLVVSDLGRGFDLETAMQRRGLGITSMQERVRLANGTISIESKPMGGTTIHVRVRWLQSRIQRQPG